MRCRVSGGLSQVEVVVGGLRGIRTQALRLAHLIARDGWVERAWQLRLWAVALGSWWHPDAHCTDRLRRGPPNNVTELSFGAPERLTHELFSRSGRRCEMRRGETGSDGCASKAAVRFYGGAGFMLAYDDACGAGVPRSADLESTSRRYPFCWQPCDPRACFAFDGGLRATPNIRAKDL